ncbi:MAG: LytTR family transcriptional regulator [Paludibacteraceae bacterium]|nr:LytTR family transcriptional regulator [Bacteroidales bacterium]MCQ2330582.1 LytTR family transcriptional regulator [Paludibacteraceae bacterium]
MRKEIIAYLKKRHNVEFLVLVIIALAGFCVLFFKPYRIHDWVIANQPILFWSEIGVMALIVVVLLFEIADSHNLIQVLQTREGQEAAERQTMYNFYDERGELKLSVKPDACYYLESADNYVQIYYTNAGKLQSLMIRNSMKNIEWRFQDSQLVRCHRSYIVNVSMVQAVRRVEGDIVLDFGDDKIPAIPVSKAYSEQIMKYFTNN